MSVDVVMGESEESADVQAVVIEPLLLNFPVPPVFLYESEAARYEVMDGQQRFNAVREFIAGDFPLTGLPVLKPLMVSITAALRGSSAHSIVRALQPSSSFLRVGRQSQLRDN